MTKKQRFKKLKKKVIDESGLSIRELAEQSGVCRGKLARWLNGEGVAGIADAVKLAEFLGYEYVEDMFV